MARRMIYLAILIIIVNFCTATVTQAKARPVIYGAVMEAAELYDIDPFLILAVIEVESQFNPGAIGGSGEIGLMQLHPKYFPSASFDIQKNILLGTRQLAIVRERCPNKNDMTWINCYNLGSSRALNHPKKFRYYKKVMNAYRKYRRGALEHE
jgi:soluble lytic murein transglycosylase